MTSRKNQLRSLFGNPVTTDIPEGAGSPQGAPSADGPPKRSSSAAVKAMGLSLGNLSQEAENAQKLRDVLASGERVIEIDPGFIEKSPYSDRLSDGAANDEEFEALRQSIATHGQQVPVLVRPHSNPEKAAQGLYQIAYGHRRVQAARALSMPVRAIVRTLDDTALVLAQGKENAERRALSFIERAFFARTLLEHGFDRATAQSALSVHKSEMSRLLQVSDAIPVNIAQAVGPAPKAGRPRWLQLGTLLAGDKTGLAVAEITSPLFRDIDSDARFQRLYDRLRSASNTTLATASQKHSTSIHSPTGEMIAELSASGAATRFNIPRSAGEGFADYVARQLPQLFVAFQEEREK